MNADKSEAIAMVERILLWIRTPDQRTAARVLIDRRGPLLTYELLRESDDPGATALQEFMKIVYADAERDHQRQLDAAEPVF